MNLENNIVDFLLEIIPEFISKLVKSKKWKNLFKDTGSFLISSCENDDQIINDLAAIFSKDNCKKIAKELYNTPGYYLKYILREKLNNLFDDYEFNSVEKDYFISQFIHCVLKYIESNDPEKYKEYFLGELKVEIDDAIKLLNEKFDLIYKTLKDAKEADIYSIYDIECDILSKSKNKFCKLENFKIDDENFIIKLNNKIENHENLTIVGKSKEETLYLVLNEIKNRLKDYSIYIVKSEKAWEKLRSNKISNCILIPFFNSNEIAMIADNINIIIIDEEERDSSEYLQLKKRLRSTLIEFLENSGYSLEQANKIFESTNGLYVPMRKYLFDIKFIKIYNVNDSDKKYVGIGLLLNQWQDSDAEFISDLIGISYDTFIEIIDKYTVGETPIFIKNNIDITEYRLASLYESWEELSNLISNKTWMIFIKKINNLYNEALMLSNDSSDNIALLKNNEATKYSQYIKKGIIKSLIMKKNYAKNNIDDYSILFKIDEFISNILDKIKTSYQFKILSEYINDICEIKPEIVYDFLNKNINNSEFLSLFQLRDNFTFGNYYYVKYLTTIEKLLYIKEIQQEVIELLFILNSHNFTYKIANSPKTLLLNIFCAWINVIPIDYKTKIILAEKMINKYENAWEIFAENLPNSNNVITMFVNPRYIKNIDFVPEKINNYNIVFEKYFELCLKYCDNCNKLKKLLEEMVYYKNDMQTKLINSFDEMVSKYDDNDKLIIKDELKQIIYNERFYGPRKFSYGENLLNTYEMLYNRIILQDKILEYKYLFAGIEQFPILHPIPYASDNSRERNNEIRENEINEKIDEFINKKLSLVDLVKKCDSKNSSLGWYIASKFDKKEFKEETLVMLIENSTEGNLKSYINYFRNKDFTSFEKAINICVTKNVQSEIIVNILDNGMINRKIYGIVSNLSTEIKKKYWEKHIIVDNSSSDIDRREFIEEVIKYGTIDSCIYLIHYSIEKLTEREIYEYFLRLSISNSIHNIDVMIGYYLEEILDIVQNYAINSNDKNIIFNLAKIEIIYYKIIDYNKMRCYKLLVKKDPRVYADLLLYIFKSDDSQLENNENDDNKGFDGVYSLFLNTKFCPAEIDGRVNYNDLKTWVKDFRELLELHKQKSIYKSMLGSLLAFSPIGDDGEYPCEAVRKIIEEEYDKELKLAYVISEKNKRGVYTPDGGKTEHELALKYKNTANYLRTEFPKTAKIFDELSEEYEYESSLGRKMAEYDF